MSTESAVQHEDDLPDAVLEAEAAIASLADSFIDWMSESLCEAKAALEAARRDVGANEAQVRTIFGIAHNMKGQGGTFGYELLTEIAAVLCEFVRESTEPVSEDALRVVEAHLAAIEFILTRRIQGDGGELRGKLVSRLVLLADTVGRPA